MYRCDFTDISFRCELYCKLEKSDISENQLLDIARSFVLKYPAAFTALEDIYEKAAMFNYRRYQSTHPRSPLPSSLNSGHYSRDSRDTNIFSDNLDCNRREKGFGRPLRAAAQDWQDIVLVRNPDKSNPGKVRGKIQMIIRNWLNINLLSFNPDNPGKKKHVLVHKSDYSEKAKQFHDFYLGKPRCFEKGEGTGSLTGFRRNEIKLHYYTLARQEYIDRWPDRYAIRYINRGIVL